MAHKDIVWRKAAGEASAGIAYTEKQGQVAAHKAVDTDMRSSPVLHKADIAVQQAYRAAEELE